MDVASSPANVLTQQHSYNSVGRAVDTLTIYLPIGVAIIGLAGVYLAHRLSKRREGIARTATACAKFRTAIISAISSIPPVTKHWDNQVLSILPSTCTIIGVAVAEFSPFIAKESLVSFEIEWQAFKKHCEEQIPKALSVSEVLYGGASPIVKVSKEKFYSHVQTLLSFAKET